VDYTLWWLLALPLALVLLIVLAPIVVVIGAIVQLLMGRIRTAQTPLERILWVGGSLTVIAGLVYFNLPTEVPPGPVPTLPTPRMIRATATLDATAARLATARASDPSPTSARAAGSVSAQPQPTVTQTVLPTNAGSPAPAVTRPPSMMRVPTWTPAPSLTPTASPTVLPTATATRPPSMIRVPTNTGLPLRRPTEAPPTVAAPPEPAGDPFDWAPGYSNRSSIKCANVNRPQNAVNGEVVIIAVDKIAETVTIANRSTTPVDVTDWYICSFTGQQLHAELYGVLPAGAVVTIGPSEASQGIWNNSKPDAAYLVLPDFTAVSYFGS
jgi:hypothetical protein